MKTKSKSAKTSKTSTSKDKPTLVAFLLDRTGSMDACRDETIKGFNGYLDELRKDGGSGIRFTLTQFDSIAVEVVHDAVVLKDVDKLTDETYQPRASTPLHDAIGKTIRATEESAGEKYKVLFVTLTDGQENASSEWNSESIKRLIKEKEEKSKWTFAYIGVGLNGFAATQAVAKGTSGASNVLRSSHKNTQMAYRSLARVSRKYAANAGAATMCCVNVFQGEEQSQES